MKKYLYGKKLHLQGWIDGKQGLRLSDIAHYSNMENLEMRDNELAKEFFYDKEQVTFTVNGRKLNPQDMTANPVMTVYPNRCFCVCLSGKGNDADLFNRFKADTCIEVDVLRLVELLKAFTSHLEGVTILHQGVNYYPPLIVGAAPDFLEAIFFKRDIYSVENEYRIALTIPAHRKFFKDENGKALPIFCDDPNDLHHMFMNSRDPMINKSYIVSVVYK
ncbi:hypothetical protein [Pseudomonas sp. GM80]|uniref:hypothetical protein n=1 Tax=Pseudomonas sp. GM80 TaxID=1144339 RepID=UPI0006985260|nr:hypothetical protein [Pseudomonas sp. GM80]